jgi:hypothetical protein
MVIAVRHPNFVTYSISFPLPGVGMVAVGLWFITGYIMGPPRFHCGQMF